MKSESPAGGAVCIRVTLQIQAQDELNRMCIVVIWRLREGCSELGRDVESGALRARVQCVLSARMLSLLQCAEMCAGHPVLCSAPAHLVIGSSTDWKIEV